MVAVAPPFTRLYTHQHFWVSSPSAPLPRTTGLLFITPMQSQHLRSIVTSVAVGALFAAGALPTSDRLVASDNFRVENAVYVDRQKKPLNRSTTIFHDGTAYDFMKTPAETVVFDKKAGRFILLNLSRQTRSELTIGEVSAFADRLQQRAAKNPDPLVKFLAAPKFQEHFNETTNELRLDSPWASYRLTLLAEENPMVVEQYHDFCDWYARLNALLTPGALPPFGRLSVNAALARHQAIPTQVLLTLSESKKLKRPRTVIRSEHRTVRPLNSADLERVEQTHKLLETFKPVRFEQYRKKGPR